VRLGELRPSHLRQFYQRLASEGRLDGREGPLSKASIVYHQRVLHRLLQAAMEDELVARNAADVAKPVFPVYDEEDDPGEVAIFTPEQVAVMEAAAADTPYYMLLYLEVRTGLRRSEILALRWMDVDLNAGTLSVRRKLYYTKEDGLSFGPPKTKRSRRTIDISPEVVAALASYRAQRGGKFTGSEDLIFHQGNGSPIFPDTITSWFPSFLESCGLPRLNFHGLRHTHASLLLAAGVDISVVSRRLGHSSIRITYDVYSHLLPDAQKDATNRLEIFLQGKSGEKTGGKNRKAPGQTSRKP